MNECPQTGQFNIWEGEKKSLLMKGWGDCLTFSLTEPAHFVWVAQTHR